MAISSTEAIANMNMCSLFPLKTVCQAHDVVLFNFLHFFLQEGWEPRVGDLKVG